MVNVKSVGPPHSVFNLRVRAKLQVEFGTHIYLFVLYTPHGKFIPVTSRARCLSLPMMRVSGL